MVQALRLAVALDAERFPRRLFWALLATELTLFFLDLTIPWARLIDVQPVRNLFNLGREDCLGNWFSSTQTLFVGIVVGLIAVRRRSRGEDPWSRRGWMVVAGFFAYMAVDDGAAIHERVGSTVKYFVGTLPLVRDYPSYTWQLAMGPFFASLGVLTAFVVARDVQDPHTRRLLFLGLSCYAAKVAIDFVEGIPGYELPIARMLGSVTYVDAVAHFQRVIEELVKMLGSSFFMLGFLRHLVSLTTEITVRFVRPTAADDDLSLDPETRTACSVGTPIRRA